MDTEKPADRTETTGEFVTEQFDYDGGRSVTVYVPPAPPEAIVFAADGQLLSGWGRVLEAAGARPTMIVGVHRTDDPDEMARIAEYSPKFDPQAFAAHETFFLDEVGRWVESRFGLTLPAERTAVCGVSAGAELALAMGLRHPDRFGTVFAASPGAGYQPPSEWPSPLPRFYLVASTEEPFFLDNATRWADAL